MSKKKSSKPSHERTCWFSCVSVFHIRRFHLTCAWIAYERTLALIFEIQENKSDAIVHATDIKLTIHEYIRMPKHRESLNQSQNVVVVVKWPADNCNNWCIEYQKRSEIKNKRPIAWHFSWMVYKKIDHVEVAKMLIDMLQRGKLEIFRFRSTVAICKYWVH